MSCNRSILVSGSISLAIAVKIAFALLAVDIAVAGAKVLVGSWRSEGALVVFAPRNAKVFEARRQCNDVDFEINESDGLRDHIKRKVCRAAL